MKSVLLTGFILAVTLTGAHAFSFPGFNFGAIVPEKHFDAEFCAEHPKDHLCLLKGPNHHDYIDMTNGNVYHWDKELHGYYSMGKWTPQFNSQGK